MTINVKYLGATNYKGSRIKVWTDWPDNKKIVKTYSYNYGENDVFKWAVKKYLSQWETITEKSGIFSAEILPIIQQKPSGPWYMAELKNHYAYTNVKAQDL